jgi:hypothetical protein
MRTAMWVRSGRVVGAAVLGFLMVSPVAAVLRYDHDHAEGEFSQIGPAFHLLLALVLVLPAMAGILLRVFEIRPAWLIALLGEALLVVLFVATIQPGGTYLLWWEYGLEGAVGYGLAALVAALFSPRP